MRIRSLAIPAVALVVAGATVLPASANHSWGNYHWARSGAVQLNIYSSVTSDWSGNLSTANSDWNQSAYLENTLVSGASDAATRQSCPAVSGAIRVCNYAYGSTGWAGIASINTGRGKNRSHITLATAKMNDTYLASADSAKRQGVMCQEVGHDFGLAHQDEDFNNPNLGTCMDYPNDWSTNQHPNAHDYDQLATIYSHNDSTPKTSGVSKIETGGTVTLITWAD
jgi:hypothetical protein